MYSREQIRQNWVLWDVACRSVIEANAVYSSSSNHTKREWNGYYGGLHICFKLAEVLETSSQSIL